MHAHLGSQEGQPFRQQLSRTAPNNFKGVERRERGEGVGMVVRHLGAPEQTQTPKGGVPGKSGQHRCSGGRVTDLEGLECRRNRTFELVDGRE